MADRGLRATSVPSARPGQQPDPAARRDALAGLLTGGFLLVVIAAVLVIVVAAPQYAEPAAGAALLPDEPGQTSLLGEDAQEAGAAAAEEPEEVMTSKPPNRLRGYRWPVRGGMIDTYYAPDRRGRFQIDGVQIHAGLVITWFEGAAVKAAHKGTVVAAGRDWAEHAGFNAPLDALYERYAPIADLKRAKKSGKPWFPQGVVIDDGNGYYSIYTEIKDLLVKRGDRVKPGQRIGSMATAEGKYMMRYRLVRMDGPWMRVHDAAREEDWPYYARERVDPLAVLDVEAANKPLMKRRPPKDPPRLSEY